MHIEIDYRHALQAVRIQSVRRSDGNIVEQTKPHRTSTLGMMSRRPHAAERVARLALQDKIGG
jgi:hypothetical protein